MKTKPSSEDIDRREEIRDEIKALVDEARRIFRDTIDGNAAESYWGPHILGALDDDHEYLGGSMSTMQDSIDALRREVDGEDDAEEAS